MEMSALFTLNELDRSIGDFRVGLAVQQKNRPGCFLE
jgi:hypothetical protein